MPYRSLFSVSRRRLSRSLLMAMSLWANPMIASDGRVSASGPVLWVLDDGSVVASGDAEASRGDSDGRERRHFEAIAGLQNIVSVSIANDDDGAAALDRQGRLWLWGADWCTRVRNESECKSAAHVPAVYSGVENVKQVAMGNGHLVGLQQDGRVFTLASEDTWSSNTYGQLGAGDLESHQELVSVGIEDGLMVAANDDVTLILRADGTVWGMGNGRSGLLGKKANRPESLLSFPETEELANSTPIKVHGLSNIRSISLGQWAAVAVDQKGSVWGWGINESAQLGAGASDLVVRWPAKIRRLKNIVAVAAGYDFTLALAADGRVHALGGNVYGGLGDKRGELEGEMRTIEGVESAVAVYGGHYNGFARLENGQFMGWGSNSFSPGGEVSLLPPTILDAGDRPAPPSEIVANGGVAVRASNELGIDQASERLELSIGGKPVGVLEIDTEITEAELRFDLPVGIHPYAVAGSARLEDGDRTARGSGLLIVTKEPMEVWLRKRFSEKGLVTAIEDLQEWLSLEGEGSFLALDLDSAGPMSEQRLSEVEAELGYELPASYRTALATEGPFRLGYPGTAYPAVALLAPDSERTVASWITAGLKLVERETADPWLAEAMTSFDVYQPELKSKEVKPLRGLWQGRWIGAIRGLGPYVIAANAEHCSSGAVPAQWPENFFDSYVDHDTGEEVPFYWHHELDCELEMQAIFESELQGALAEAYRQAGVVFLSPDSEGGELWVAFESVTDDGDELSIRLSGGSWSE